MLFVSVPIQSLNLHELSNVKKNVDFNDLVNIGQTDLGLNGFSTAQRSGLTLKPCSMRPIVKGNAPPG